MFELRLSCAESAVEPISDALEALDALSVSAEDADADTGAEKALFGEPGLPPPAPGWSRTTVLALFNDETAARQAAALLAAQDFFTGATIQAIAPVPEQDWVRLTQSQFEPVAITPQFWVVPSWHAVPAAARQVIRLDPGLAFGTCTHPTTRMCLRWIAARAPLGPRVLDYGCGSGILAIGAALHGSGVVDAVDIDPAAVESTVANAQANLAHLKAADGSLPIVAGLPDVVGEAQATYPVVLANILATPLKMLSPLLAGHVAPGGHLVLAGILARQEQELKDAYAEVGLQLQVANAEEGWILMTAQKPAKSMA